MNYALRSRIFGSNENDKITTIKWTKNKLKLNNLNIFVFNLKSEQMAEYYFPGEIYLIVPCFCVIILDTLYPATPTTKRRRRKKNRWNHHL